MSQYHCMVKFYPGSKFHCAYSCIRHHQCLQIIGFESRFGVFEKTLGNSTSNNEIFKFALQFLIGNSIMTKFIFIQKNNNIGGIDISKKF